MKASFDSSLMAVLLHEGGYVNNPHDPGGATNRGVTQAVYDDWRLDRKLTPRSVKFIATAEVEQIYRERYWDKIRGDDLPAGVDYCTFDFAVNSGVMRSAKFLQRVSNVVADGKIGPMTIAAVKAVPAKLTIDMLCNERLAFLRSLGTFKHFGKGWVRRVEDVRAKAKAMK